jgi:hypothetical protein
LKLLLAKTLQSEKNKLLPNQHDYCKALNPQLKLQNRFAVLGETEHIEDNEDAGSEDENRDLVTKLRRSNDKKRVENTKTSVSKQTDKTNQVTKDDTAQTGRNEQVADENATSAQTKPRDRARRDKPPPINIYDQNVKDTIELVSKELNIKDFHVKNSETTSMRYFYITQKTTKM